MFAGSRGITPNEQGFVAGAEFMTIHPVLKPNKITKDEVKK
jgi:hypothetical protein